MPDDLTGATPQGDVSASGGADAGSATRIPKGLERFAGQDGRVDVIKLGQSYLELEKGFHGTRQEMATLRRAYDALAPKADTPPPDTGDEFSRLVDNPRGYTENVADAAAAKRTQTVLVALLELAHPELKDNEFREKLEAYAATLPPHIQQGLTDYSTADWVVRSFKQHNAPAAPAPNADGGERPNMLEPPSGSRPKTNGKTWKRSEIRKMQRQQPDEYARLADEIATAYEEGRVLRDA